VGASGLLEVNAGRSWLAVAADEVRNAQILVIALEQTIASLRERGGSDLEENIETLTLLRDATIAKVHEIDPSVQFEHPIKD
jgi:hypothetical protein